MSGIWRSSRIRSGEPCADSSSYSAVWALAQVLTPVMPNWLSARCMSLTMKGSSSTTRTVSGAGGARSATDIRLSLPEESMLPVLMLRHHMPPTACHGVYLSTHVMNVFLKVRRVALWRAPNETSRTHEADSARHVGRRGARVREL